MKLLALGGAGAMGRVAARVAAALPGVHELVIADRDLDAARRAAALAAGSPVPVRATRVDVTDERELHAALAEADAVVNTVGPYYRYGLDVLRAAIRTGTHYLDICDDWEPTVEMLELHDDARAAGVRAVLGMGASPGVSNLLAARATARLDTLTDVHTAWPVDVDPEADTSLRDPSGAVSAAAVHWMQQISGTVAAVEGGRLVRRPPLRPVTLDLPGGHRGTAYTVGHPEPVTLHRSLRPAGDAANLMVMSVGTAAYLHVLRDELNAGRLTNESAAAGLDHPTVRRALRAAARAPRLRGPGTLPPFFAAATGTRDGRPAAALARLNGAEALLADMAEATGVPAGLGLAQLLDGTMVPAGVHAPEAVIDGERFFRDLARECPGVEVVEEL
ncbi:saccharopine dehydrogenase NADP-binding domain-containing protein [Streptomyces sp. RS10V-4]|uniref:saccharopine dehydrogenase family protein n=1 Tax=Streptomyces rhizoryzae TaxID=2932493 RepID=UPI002002D157|nr:saccharopine dehydrogenase NADP-binding domain-containing protein [Streptomyces rhizoryzae]MCK7621620.1 saccharopine dehydrogenase NADP-binding domain-containing protein [Streptomyces rhizoryzae]